MEKLERPELARSVPTVSVSWSALYSEHAGGLVSFLRKITGNPEVAEDLVQETFVRAMRSGAPTDLRSTRAWLFRIAANLANDYHRRRRLVRFVPFSGREVVPADVDYDADAVHQALRRLPATLSMTLLLHYDAGFSRKEIAEMEGVSEDAIKARLARGREAFARAFE